MPPGNSVKTSTAIGPREYFCISASNKRHQYHSAAAIHELTFLDMSEPLRSIYQNSSAPGRESKGTERAVGVEQQSEPLKDVPPPGDCMQQVAENRKTFWARKIGSWICRNIAVWISDVKQGKGEEKCPSCQCDWLGGVKNRHGRNGRMNGLGTGVRVLVQFYTYVLISRDSDVLGAPAERRIEHDQLSDRRPSIQMRGSSESIRMDRRVWRGR